MPAPRLSVEKRVFNQVKATPGQTATVIAKLTQANLAVVSSYLAKGTRTGIFERKLGVGPRGGYGYWPTLKESDRPTFWERLVGGAAL